MGDVAWAQSFLQADAARSHAPLPRPKLSQLLFFQRLLAAAEQLTCKNFFNLGVMTPLHVISSFMVSR